MRALGLQVVIVFALGLLGHDAWCSHVVVVQPVAENAESFHASNHAMIAELALAGFTVSVQRLESDSDLQETLPRVANRPGVLAAVSVTRRGDVSVGYLWFRQADAAVVVEERANQAVVAHSVVVLKLTELLREHQLHLPTPDGAASLSEPPSSEPRSSEPRLSEPRQLEPSPREPTIETPPDAVQSRSGFMLRPWLGVGVDTLGPARTYAWHLGSLVELAVSRRFSLTASASFPLSSHELNSDLGSADLRVTELSAGALFAMFHGSRFGVALGPRVGLRFLQAEANPSADRDAQHASTRVLTLGANVRGVYHPTSALRLGLMVGGSWLTPEPRLASDSGDVASLGSVVWSSCLLIGWEVAL